MIAKKKKSSSNIRARLIYNERKKDKKLHTKWNFLRGLPVAGLGVWLLFCIIFWEKIQNGFWLLRNNIGEKAAMQKGRIYLFYKVDEDISATWFWVAISGILTLLFFCWVQRSKKSWRYIWTKTVALALVAALWIGIWNVPGINQVPEAVNHGLEIAVENMDDIRYGTNENAGLCNGNLCEAYKKNTSKEIVLEVIMSEPESMYLRGFVGEQYKDGKWRTIDNGVIYKDWDLFYWLHKRGFYGQTQLASFARNTQEQAENIINIRNLSADRRYIYLPYETASCALLQEDMIGDRNTKADGMTGEDNYQLTAYSGIRCEYPKLLEERKALGDGGELQVNDNMEQHYREWVYEHYLQVPERFQRQFMSSLGIDNESGLVSIIEAKGLVLQYLQENFTYEEEPGKVPEEEDALLWFMQKSGKGYDVQYASAATLLFRYLGVPSRYVEGYLVTRQQAESIDKSQVIALDGSAGHAWTEIYVDGVGWLPFEATISYRDDVTEAEEISLEEESDSVPEELKGYTQLGASQTESNNVSQSDDGSGKTLAQEIQEDTKKEKNNEWMKIFGEIVLIVLIILIIYIFVKIRKKRREFWKGMNNLKRKEACQFIFLQVMNILYKKGFVWNVDENEVNFRRMTECFSREYVEEFIEMWNLHERIRFAGKSVEETSYKCMLKFYKKTKSIKRIKKIS